MSAPARIADRALLRASRLTVEVAGAARPLLRDAHVSLEPGGTLGVVGPSGAGKSTLALAIAGLLPRGARLAPGSTIHLGSTALHALDPRAMRDLRGRRLGFVFQEPALALDPAMPIGAQVAETAIVHGIPPREAAARAVAMLDRVGFADAARAARRYPHELSGGMRQRALIASAMLLAPELLIADEPTTALDPTIQAQVLDLIDRLREESGTALLLISHDLALVAERCERVLTIEGGEVTDDRVAAQALAAYRGRRQVPDVALPALAPERVRTGTLLEARGLAVTYAPAHLLPLARRAAAVTAVHPMDLTIAHGEVVALVGESGCGKTSVGHALLRLVEPAAGRIVFDGTDVRALAREPLRQLRRRMQVVPQDAGASLTPHLTCEALVAEGLEVHGLAVGEVARDCARALLDELGLPRRAATARPRELSSGERQRVAIARALATDPDLLVCDEPLASVDEAARAHVLGVLAARRAKHGMAILLISHDLDAVRRLASRVLVMYLGKVVEEAPGAAALTTPAHPYAQALVAAIPSGASAVLRRLTTVRGELPRLAPDRGCPFAPRCQHPLKDDRCRSEHPSLAPLMQDRSAHRCACWHATLPPAP
ncbi:MAG: ABC transporter ATP-binding protein [Gemmatimonadaceae bacterium]|nr:ABC transporter ATP-binding protein [Gemmatimonadaceae bacterium]